MAAARMLSMYRAAAILKASIHDEEVPGNIHLETKISNAQRDPRKGQPVWQPKVFGVQNSECDKQPKENALGA